jgi:excisionase family DNA binding protein
MVSKATVAARLPIRRGLSEMEAAVYLSLSPSFFRRLVDQGVMPRPRLAGNRRIWDIEELDVAFKALAAVPVDEVVDVFEFDQGHA